MKFNFIIALCLLAGICAAQQKSTTNTIKSDNLSVTVTEKDNSYVLDAKFNPAKTEKVRKHMNETIGRGARLSFSNTDLDADVVLDNGAKFYIKSKDGKLELKLDKRKNSAEIYARFKKMCEGIRNIIGEK